MALVSPQDNPLRVSTNKGETVTLTLDAGAPVTIQLDVRGQCSCGALPELLAHTQTPTSALTNQASFSICTHHGKEIT